MWPGLKIIHGRPRHSQSQGSVERLNQTAERMLQKYCAGTGEGWVSGCIRAQWAYNLVITLEWGRSSIHVAVYGFEPRLGFAGFRLPPELLEGADDDKGLVVELQLAGLAQTYAFEQVTGTNDPSNVIDLEKEVALGVDSSSAHEDNVESETDMTEHDHENVKVGEDMGAYSGRKFVMLVSYCLAGKKKNSVKSAMQA